MGFEDIDINNQIIQLGLNVLHFRKLRNYSQDELSEKSGISTVVISRIENSTTNPELITILKIAKGLSIEPRLLFEFKNYD